MKYDFDKIIDRYGTASVKYDLAKDYGKPEDILPLWVADMDFQAPPSVVEALISRSQHGIFGYTVLKPDYYEAVQSWFTLRYGWEIRNDWLISTPGVVFAINLAVRALTNPGEGIIIQQPVYNPFKDAILNNGRKLVINHLKYENGKYAIDFADFEDKITREKVKMFILSSPHNPVGRVWTQDELANLGDICKKHNVLAVADEIHADFIYTGHKHHVFAKVKPDFADFSIICTAPTKTFNLAGLQVSNIFIPNANIRKLFLEELKSSGCSHANVMGLIACQAAYSTGGEWLDALINYLEGNIEFLHDFLEKHIPQIRLVKPEGTYLAWLDCNALGLDDNSLKNLLVNRAGIWLIEGTAFGPSGSGFQRMNIACPRSILENALKRLEKAINSLN
jgi:cystathionine beta-lyase